jgi:pimeloyl-ACP methyl ester carboxylesterase
VRTRPAGPGWVAAVDELTLEDVATEFIEDIERASMENVVLVGHSLGGQAMALMAELQPGLFRRLVYVSCLIPLPGQNVAQMMGTGLRGSNPDEAGQPRPRIQPVGDRRKPSRLGEADLVGRDSHAHIVPSAQQLTADSNAGLDIAARSIACQHEFHCET